MSIAGATPTTVVDRFAGRRSIAVNALLVASGAAAVGVAAQTTIPLWPVPVPDVMVSRDARGPAGAGYGDVERKRASSGSR